MRSLSVAVVLCAFSACSAPVSTNAPPVMKSAPRTKSTIVTTGAPGGDFTLRDNNVAAGAVITAPPFATALQTIVVPLSYDGSDSNQTDGPLQQTTSLSIWDATNGVPTGAPLWSQADTDDTTVDPRFPVTTFSPTAAGAPVPVTAGTQYFFALQEPSTNENTSISVPLVSSSSSGLYLYYAGYGWFPRAGVTLAYTATFVDGTTTSVTTSGDASFGDTVTLTPTVTGAGAAPTGTVSLTATASDGMTVTPLGSVALSGVNSTTSTASFTTTALPLGSGQTITATYVPATGDDHDASSGIAAINVAAAATTITISANTNPTTPNTTDSLFATVSGAASDGTITFYDDALDTVILCSATLAASTCYATFAAVGDHPNINAVFTSNDPDYAGSTSAAIDVEVDAATPLVTVTSSDSGSGNYGDLPTFTATVSNGVSPTGTVTFFVGAGPATSANTLCDSVALDATLLTATCTLTTPLGADDGSSQVINAQYNGDTNNKSATGTFNETVAVNEPVVTITSSDNGTGSAGDFVTFTVAIAVPTHGTNPSGNVQFYVGSSQVDVETFSAGSNSVSSAKLQFTSGAGSYDIRVTYDGDANYDAYDSTVSSQDFTQTITAIPGPDVSLGSSSTSVLPNASVSLTASITDYVVGMLPTNTITFYDTFNGGTATSLGSGTIDTTKEAATLTTAALAAGTHVFSCQFEGDPSYNQIACTNTVTVTVSTAATTVSVVSSDGLATFGESLTFTATITPSNALAGIPSGKANFTDSITANGITTTKTICADATVTAGTATSTIKCTTSALSINAHTITANYDGDANNTASSGTILQNVAQDPTSVTIKSSKTTTSYGEAVTFTATVTATGTPAITGTFTFDDGVTTLATGLKPDDNGQVSFTTSTLSVGSHTILAAFGNDTIYAKSFNTLTQSVNQTVSNIALTSSSNPAGVDVDVSISAVVTAAVGSAVPTGIVQLFDGTTQIASLMLASGTVTFTTKALTVGSHPISAKYLGDMNFILSTGGNFTQVINASAGTLAVSASPSPATFGQAVTLVGTVSGTLGSATGTITITEGTASVGSITLATSGTGTTTISNLTPGTHTYTTAYSGDSTYFKTSGGFVLVVNQAASTTKLTSSNNPAPVGDAVVFSVAVSSSATGLAGMVQLFDGQASLGTAALASGFASFSINTLTAGTHSITAKYLGNVDFVASSSTALSETIQGTVMMGSDAGTQGASDMGMGKSGDGSTTTPDDFATTTTTKKKSGGCDITVGTTSTNGTGAFMALMLIGLVVLLRRRA